jgi:putative sugar O-methyltransferase
MDARNVTEAVRRSLRRRSQHKAVKLSDAERLLLARMREDNAGAAEPFRATEYWTELNGRFDRWFRNEGIKNVEKQAYNTLFSSPDRRSGKYHYYALHLLYQAIKAKDHHDVLDRVSASPTAKSSVEFEGRRVSWDLLISIDTMYSLGELDERVWEEPVVLGDLGAGWGRIGHVAKSVNPQLAYVVLDLPESLLVASSFLPRMLPDETFYTYEQNRAITGFTREELLAAGGVRFCGTQDLDRFADGSIDLFVNVASFQEMTRAQVSAYLGIADRTAESVYLQQRRVRPRALPESMISGFDEYDFPARWERRFLRTVPFSDQFFETGFSVARHAGAVPSDGVAAERR